MKLKQQQGRSFKNKLLGPRQVPSNPSSKGGLQKLPSYKNRIRSIERLLRRVSLLEGVSYMALYLLEWPQMQAHVVFMLAYG